MIPVASTRGSIADYAAALLTVYFVMLLVRILLTWVPRIPYNPYRRRVISLIEEVTDPYLNLFRRFIPPVGGGGFALDLSPILAMLVLFLVGGLVVGAIRG